MSNVDELKAKYGDEFYLAQQDGSLRSALHVLPFIFDLLSPQSVCDFGCGTGSWLSVAKMLGATSVLGIDGPHVELDKLKIERHEFLAHNFEVPLSLGRRFDLTMTLEVIEHFEDRFSTGFLDSLTATAPIILFSAAVPGQGGTHHVNERWPSYWLRQFEEREYYAFDCIRPRIWRKPEVDWWYAQNTFLIASATATNRLGAIAETRVSTATPMLNVVHPGKLNKRPAIDYKPKA